LTDSAPLGGKVLTELSNAIVALHRRHFGRGADAAKSYLINDMAVCMLSDIYTTVEKTLIEAGKHEHVRQTRLLHQIALESEYVAAAERVTGRKVESFISAVHFDPDVAFEIFMFAPDSGGGEPPG
jgi:uncharacterized protein YbcI